MKTIVIIDDDENILRLLKTMITRIGYSTVTYSSSIDSLEYFKNHKVDCVFLDLAMPVLDGYGVLKIIRRIDPDIKVLIISGMGIDSDQFLESDNTKFLIKPFLKKDILAALASLGIEP